MKIIVSKIWVLLLLFSFSGEIGRAAFSSEDMYCIIITNDDSEDKKEENKKTKDEEQDKINHRNNDFQLLATVINRLSDRIFINTSAYISLPEIPPDPA